MNIYVTTESETKLKMLFTNIKSFYILDVQSFVNSFKLDLTKQPNIYFINCELINTIKASSKLKKYQGIIYINKNLSPELLSSLKTKLKSIKEINKFILIDNGILPKLQNLYNYFEEIYFYERFYKNKIIECQGINEDSEGNLSIDMDEACK